MKHESCENLLKELQARLPSFRTAILIEGKSGLSVAHHTIDEGLKIDAVSAVFRNFLALASQANKMLVTTPDQARELLINYNTTSAFVRPFCNGTMLLLLVLGQGADKGAVSEALDNCVSKLSELF